MKRKYSKMTKINYKNKYRIFDRNADESEREAYHSVKNSSDVKETIEQFLVSNHLDSIVHTKLFIDQPCDDEVVTLIGSNQIMQINDALYKEYRDEINNKLSEDMNYEVIKDFISEDTEFILNLCSSGLIYNSDNTIKIDKVYVYLLDEFSRQFITALFNDLIGNNNSKIEIYPQKDKEIKLVCGDRSLLINHRMYNHILYDISKHNKAVSSNKILIKK